MNTFIFRNSQFGSSVTLSTSIIPTIRNWLSIIAVTNLVKGAGTLNQRTRNWGLTLEVQSWTSLKRKNSIVRVKCYRHANTSAWIWWKCLKNSTAISRTFTFSGVHRLLFCQSGEWHWMSETYTLFTLTLSCDLFCLFLPTSLLSPSDVKMIKVIIAENLNWKTKTLWFPLFFFLKLFRSFCSWQS